MSNTPDVSKDNLQKQDLQNKLKQKRRTRHDPLNRDFYCGCGKSYLSYPALYTHIKQKHDSKPPQGTVVPQEKKSSSKDMSKCVIKQEDNLQYQYLNELQDPDPIEEILLFLDSINIEHKKQKTQDDDYSPWDQIQKIFPTEYFTSPDDYQTVLDLIQESSFESFHEELDVARDIKKTNLNRIFAIFLIAIQQFVNSDVFVEIAIFICFYRKALNKYGWQQLGYLENRDKEFCQSNQGESALIIGNELIIDYLPQFFQEKREYNLNLKIIGESEEQLKNAVYLIQYFSSWLFANKYSNAKLGICTDDNQSIL